MIVVRETVRIFEVCLRHAYVTGAGVHKANEVRLRAADLFCQSDGDIVCGFCNERQDGVGNRYLVAGVEIELRGSDRRRRLGNRNFVRHLEPAGLDSLERQVERHHFGERGGVANRIAVVVVQNSARIGVKDHRGVALGPSLCVLRNQPKHGRNCQRER